MGASVGSQFLIEKPAGIPTLAASAAVASREGEATLTGLVGVGVGVGLGLAEDDERRARDRWGCES